MTAKSKPAPRVQLIKVIHTLAGKAGLDDAAYRDMLAAQSSGKRSCKNMTIAELITVREHLDQAVPRKHPLLENQPRNIDVADRAEMKKIRALLKDAGLTWGYACTILRNQTGGKKAKLEFASTRELVGVLTALENAALKRLKLALDAELQRQGLEWTVAEHIARQQFGMSINADLARSTELMSIVLRHLTGAA